MPIDALRCPRRVKEPSAVCLPQILPETHPPATRVQGRVRRTPRPAGMRAIPVGVLLELTQLPLEIAGRPEQHAIQTLASERPDQPFDDGMRARYMRHGLDFLDVQDRKFACH